MKPESRLRVSQFLDEYLIIWSWMILKHFYTLVLLRALSCFHHSPNSQAHVHKLHHVQELICTCMCAFWKGCMHPTHFFLPAPNIDPRCSMLRFIELFNVRSGFTSRTVHQVTRQSLVKFGDPETFSLWDAMSISSTEIFHRKIKGAGVTTFPRGHK